MADFATINTARFFVDYTALSTAHTMMFRVPRGTTPAQLEPWFDKVDVFLDALDGLLYTDWAITGVRFAEEDSPLSFPIGHNITSPTGAVAVPTDGLDAAKARHYSFTGRSSGGSPAAVFLYGLLFNEDAAAGSGWRHTSAESTPVLNAVAALNGSPANVGVDNNPVVWRPYANLKFNDHQLRKARRG